LPTTAADGPGLSLAHDAHDAFTSRIDALTDDVPASHPKQLIAAVAGINGINGITGRS
jgi:hypothetical protein